MAKGNGDFKIEKGIPITKLPGKVKYPIFEMEVGDSFFLRDANHQTISGSITHAKMKTGRNFAARMVEGGIRVWRTR